MSSSPARRQRNLKNSQAHSNTQPDIAGMVTEAGTNTPDVLQRFEEHFGFLSRSLSSILKYCFMVDNLLSAKNGLATSNVPLEGDLENVANLSVPLLAFRCFREIFIGAAKKKYQFVTVRFGSELGHGLCPGAPNSSHDPAHLDL